MTAIKTTVPGRPTASRVRLVAYRLRYVAVPALLWAWVLVLLLAPPGRLMGRTAPRPRQRPLRPHPRPPAAAARLPPLPPRISCFGARGRLLSESPDDDLQQRNLSVSYPTPFLGSHRELGLAQTWMTADGRFGPYGFGQDEPGYNRSRVNWDELDWGRLQDACFERNARRFPRPAPSARIRDQVRFSLRNETGRDPTPEWHAFEPTRRTALVVRGYSGFQFRPEHLWSLRSLITEAALKSGAEYAVFLLVHIQDGARNIFASRDNYDAAFRAANIPPELQSIAVLWDDHLLGSWYKSVREHRMMWQVNQPLQLFALHYPEFDHYWQIELDQRFTGDAGAYLDAVSAFARREPRKQALERASYAFRPRVHGSYGNLTAEVDRATGGGSRAWGPVRIPDVAPAGPAPPVARPQDDGFAWGVGEDADVVVSSFCADVLRADWVFRDYTEGLRRGRATPRWFCPPAVARASRTLLLLVHEAQHDRGLSVPSEAVFPSWALWHGLKLSYPPQPAYLRPPAAGRDGAGEAAAAPGRAGWFGFFRPVRAPWFGHSPGRWADGTSHGNPQSLAGLGLTWWWASDWPRKIADVWLAGDTDAEEMPGVLAVHDGKVYAPNLAMHPVKA